METRREIKRHIAGCGTLLRNARNLSDEEHQEILQDLNQCLKQLEDLECRGDEDLIAQRRVELKNNASLYDIFSMLWALVQDFSDESGQLSKDGYVRIHRALQCALHGPSPLTAEFDKRMIDVDWKNDLTCFGAMSRLSFYDSLFENIESLTDMVDPFYYPAFVWALLDAIADTRKFPPRFRPYTDIKCFVKHPNYGELYAHYREKKGMRLAMHISDEWMQRVPEIQKRLKARREGRTITPDLACLAVSISMRGGALASSGGGARGGELTPVADSVLTTPEDTPPVSDRAGRAGQAPSPAAQPAPVEVAAAPGQEPLGEEEELERASRGPPGGGGDSGGFLEREGMTDSPLSRPSTQETRRRAEELHRQGLWEPAGAVHHPDVVRLQQGGEVQTFDKLARKGRPERQRRTGAKGRKGKAASAQGKEPLEDSGEVDASSLMGGGDEEEGEEAYEGEEDGGQGQAEELAPRPVQEEEQDGRPRWVNSFGVPRESSMVMLGLQDEAGAKTETSRWNSSVSVDRPGAAGATAADPYQDSTPSPQREKDSRPRWGQPLLASPPVKLETPRVPVPVVDEVKSEFQKRLATVKPKGKGKLKRKPPVAESPAGEAPGTEALASSGAHALLAAQRRIGVAQEDEDSPLRVLRPTPVRDQRPVLVVGQYQPYEEPYEEPPLPEGIKATRFGLIKKDTESADAGQWGRGRGADRHEAAHRPVSKALAPVKVEPARQEDEDEDEGVDGAPRRAPRRKASSHEEEEGQRALDAAHRRFLKEQEDAHREYLYSLDPSLRPVREVDEFLASYAPPEPENPVLEEVLERISAQSLGVVNDRELHDGIRRHERPVSPESMIPANYRSVSPGSGEDGQSPYLRHMDPATERHMSLAAGLQPGYGGNSGSGWPSPSKDNRRSSICAATSYGGFTAPSSPEIGPEGMAGLFSPLSMPPQDPPQPPSRRLAAGTPDAASTSTAVRNTSSTRTVGGAGGTHRLSMGTVLGERRRDESPVLESCRTVSVPERRTVVTREGKALSNPNLLPPYPRRATGKVLIHMLHETDSILLPVGNGHAHGAGDDSVDGIVVQGAGAGVRRRGTSLDVTHVRARNNSHSDLRTEAVSPVRLAPADLPQPDAPMMLPTSAIKIPLASSAQHQHGGRSAKPGGSGRASPSFTDDFVEDDELSTLSAGSVGPVSTAERQFRLKMQAKMAAQSGSGSGGRGRGGGGGGGAPTSMMAVYHQRLNERRRLRAEELARYTDDASSTSGLGGDLTAYNHVNQTRPADSMQTDSGKLESRTRALPNSTSTLIMIVDRRLKELNPRIAMEPPQEKKDRMRSHRFSNLMGTAADPRAASPSKPLGKSGGGLRAQVSCDTSLDLSSNLTTATLESLMDLRSPPLVGTAPPSDRPESPSHASGAPLRRSDTSLTDCTDVGMDATAQLQRSRLQPRESDEVSLLSLDSVRFGQMQRFREKFQSNSLLAPVPVVAQAQSQGTHGAALSLSRSTGDLDSVLPGGTKSTRRGRRTKPSPNLHYGESLSQLPAETVVHMPALVVRSRYTAGPINIMDGLKSGGCRSGSTHRTFNQSLSHTVTAPLVPASTCAVSMVDSLCSRGLLPHPLQQAQGSDATSTCSGLSSLSTVSRSTLSQFPCFASNPMQCPPWIPEGALTAKDNIHSNELLATKDHNLVKRFEDMGVIHDSSVQTMVIKRQSAARASFESFAAAVAASDPMSVSAARSTGFGAGPVDLAIGNSRRW